MDQPADQMWINLGCGHNWNPRWTNVDFGPYARLGRLRKLRVFNRLLPKRCFGYPKNLVVSDLRRPLPFPDHSAAVVFSCYVLEYLTRKETEPLLKECHRVLRPGGLIRLCQPSIESVIEHYQAHYSPQASPAAVPNADFFLLCSAPEHTKLSVRLFRRGGHQQMFDRPSIEFLLQQAGFVEVTFHKLHEGQCPDLPDIEHPSFNLPFIHVEARTPS